MKSRVRRQGVTTLAVVMMAFASGAAWASDKATAAEAEAMVKKGVAYIKANGKDKAYAEINRKGSQFRDRDLYLTVFGFDGTTLAHAVNERMVGKFMLDFQDTDGKQFYKERLELAKSKGTFWQDYKFTNPVTKKIEQKTAYCERVEDTVVCGGIYK